VSFLRWRRRVLAEVARDPAEIWRELEAEKARLSAMVARQRREAAAVRSRNRQAWILKCLGIARMRTVFLCALQSARVAILHLVTRP
jgi:hypothetical protein